VIWAFLTFAGGLCRLFMSVPAVKKYASVPRSSSTNSVPCQEPYSRKDNLGLEFLCVRRYSVTAFPFSSHQASSEPEMSRSRGLFEQYRGLRCRSDWFFRRSVRHPHASVRIAVSRTTGMWIRSRLAKRRFLATPAPAAKCGVSERSDSEVAAGP
jgi:hypothetical protein